MGFQPSARIIGITMPVEDEDYPESLGLTGPRDLIEYSGRWDYGEGNVKKMWAREDWIAKRLATGEESMVEMVDILFLVTCSRVVSHELVRHRLASYQQESQRFTNYANEAPEDLFYLPPEVTGEARSIMGAMLYAMSLEVYNKLSGLNVAKQLARYVLPNATRTRIVVKMNVREWRHVLRLRLHTSVQPEMREVMAIIHRKCQARLGADLFPDDIAVERAAR